MCGFVGANCFNKNQINQLNQLLNHRGPDQEGIFQDKNIVLAHKRLSILDLSTRGNQPMIDPGNNYILVYNGEIYNYLEIKQQLLDLGYSFKSNTDTEVVLYAYMAWQEHCLAQFNGQFSFCIYDRKKQIFFLARDRLGINPLFYYLKNDQFIFGSELKLILKSNLDLTISQTSLNHYILFSFCPVKQSIIKHAYKLEPGCFLKYDLNSNRIIEEKKYWQNRVDPICRTSYNQIKSDIYNKLDQAVSRRLISDVPVGAFLSGGLDSSIIVYFMRKYISDLKTFSIRFDYPDYNESHWAKIIADQFKTKHYEIEFNSRHIRESIPDLVYSFDEPFGDYSMLPTFLVSKVAKQHVTVCLSGTGGDELFAGYARHKEYLNLLKLNILPQPIKTLLVQCYSLINKDKSSKLNTLLKEKNRAALYLKLFSYLYRDDHEFDFNDQAILQQYKRYFNSKDKIANLLNFDQNEYLANDLLVKEDRSTMAVSLEGRVPFLDHELVEYVNQIQSHYKLNGQTSKLILKKIFEDKLPKNIIYRKKKGFGVPLKHYFRHELKEFIYAHLFCETTYQYYQKSYLLKIWDKHQNQISDYSRLFWAILMFNRWYQKWFLDQD